MSNQVSNEEYNQRMQRYRFLHKKPKGTKPAKPNQRMRRRMRWTPVSAEE